MKIYKLILPMNKPSVKSKKILKKKGTWTICGSRNYKHVQTSFACPGDMNVENTIQENNNNNTCHALLPNRNEQKITM